MSGTTTVSAEGVGAIRDALAGSVVLLTTGGEVRVSGVTSGQLEGSQVRFPRSREDMTVTGVALERSGVLVTHVLAEKVRVRAGQSLVLDLSLAVTGS